MVHYHELARIVELRRTARLLLVAACLIATHQAQAFPGVCVTSQGAEPTLGTTHLVLLQHADVSVVTSMVDYRGPLEPFALVLPVPADVTPGRLQTVKHEFIGRLEEVTAPRFVEFWEKDPCAGGPAEQAWDAKIPVKNRGFLTPEVLPPRDSHYPVSNELSVPSKPIFKGHESEFRFHLLRPASIASLESWLSSRGYQAGKSLAVLAPFVEPGYKLLVAEVLLDHVELIAPEHVQLAGIRYWTRQPTTQIASQLGLNGKQQQDLFIYTLSRQQRYEAKNYENQFAPTNLRVRPEFGRKIGALYNALHDLLSARHPRVILTEFSGSTDECGEPCPNAPLQLRELMTLGGDVLEAETLAPADMAPTPAPETDASRRHLETAWQGLSPAKRVEAKRLHERYQRELRERRALVARQKYLLTRLHYRYAADGLPHAIEIGPAQAHVRGGYGVPKGPAAALSRAIQPAKISAYQVRFSAARPWQGELACSKPQRWRWGKRWKSHSQHLRKIHVARDLPRLGRDRQLLKSGLLSAVPELGLTEAEPKSSPPPHSDRPITPVEAPGCSAVAPAASHRKTAPALSHVALLMLLWLARRRDPAGAPWVSSTASASGASAPWRWLALASVRAAWRSR